MNDNDRNRSKKYYDKIRKEYLNKFIFLPSKRIDKFKSTPPESVMQKASDRHKDLENMAFEQDISLKRNTLIALFAFLAIETLAVFAFAALQAMKVFALEEWSFKLLIGSTITQITIMLNVAVKHLFPTK